MDRSAALALLPPADPAAIAALKASSEDDREFGWCVGKNVFADAASAEAQAIWVNKSEPGATHYKCRFCNGWHVGNRPSRKRRLKVRR